MIPARIWALDSFPLTAHGKLDRDALPDPWEVQERRAELAQAEPESVTEGVLAAVFGEVLGGIAVGRDDNFFALGGDSILSIRILGLARARGLHFSLQDLFQFQTVKQLARQIASARETVRSSVAYEPFCLISPAARRKLPPDVVDAYPLSMLQLGMLYEMRRTPDLLPYHNVDSMTIRGALDRDAFVEAVQMLADRHPIFRTSIHLGGFGKPLQLVHRHGTLGLEWHDLRGLAGDEQQRIVDDLVRRESRSPHDLKTPGLLRFAVHRLAEDRFQFTLTECHAILDGWSLTSALAELFERHFRIAAGGDRQPLPPPALRYAEHIRDEQRLLAEEPARGFWRRQLGDLAGRTIPRWSAPERGAGGLNEVVWTLPSELVESLRRMSRECQVPLKSVFLAAHVKVSSLLLGTGDVVIGMQSNGRPEAEGGDEVYGLYLNAMPLRISVRAGEWKRLVQEVFRAEWEALPYRAFPLAAIQELTGGRPPFEVFFNFVSFHSLDRVVRSRLIEVVGESQFVEPNHFPLLAGFNLDPVSNQVTAVLQSAGGQFPHAQLLAFRRYYDAVFAGLVAASLADAPLAGRHDVWPCLPAAERHWLSYEGGAVELADQFPARRVEDAVLAAAEAAAAQRAERQSLVPYEPPATPTEEILAAVWAEVLGVERVGRDDGFFNLGGDSIISLRSMAAAEERGLSFSLQQLYELATLRGLALAIDRQALPAVSAPPPEPFALIGVEARYRLPAGAVDAYPLASLQLGMLYHMELDPELRPYHNVDSGLFRAPMVKAAFLQAVQQVVDRHPILRTGFDLQSYGEPLQVVHRTAAMEVVWEDLRDLAPAAREARFGSFMAGERQRLFELARPPMLRYAVHLMDGEVFRLTMTENHVALDGWSFNAILSEVFGGYFRLLAGEAMPPPPSPALPYSEFVRLEQLAVGSPESRSFWREQVTACPRLLLGAPTGSDGDGDGDVRAVFEHVSRVVPAAEAAAFQRFARRWTVPLKTVLLAVHVKVLSWLAGAEEVVTGLVVNGRPETAGGADTYGLFLNTVPFRLRVPAAADWEELVGQVFDQERRILPHRRVPMSVIQADYGQQALYEVMFNYVSFHSLRPVLEREDFAFLGDVRSASPTHYPLAVSFNVNPLDGELLLILDSGSRQLSRRRLAAVGELYLAALRGLAAGRADVAGEIPGGVLEWIPAVAGPGAEAAVAPVVREPPAAPLTVALRLGGRIDEWVLAASLAALARRYAGWRAAGEDGLPGAEEPSFALCELDLGALPAGKRAAALLRLASEALEAPLPRSTRLRAGLVREGARQRLLLLSLWRSGAPAWLPDVLRRDLGVLYRSCLAEGGAPPPEDGASRDALARWRRHRAAGNGNGEDVAYWRQRLAGLRRLELPADRPRPATLGFAAWSVPFEVPAALAATLRSRAGERVASLDAVLLAALAVLLGRHAAQADVTIGLPFAGVGPLRPEALGGLLLDVRPLRTDLSGSGGAGVAFGALVEQVQAAALAARAHGSVPFDRLAEILGLPVDAGRPLLFDAMLVMAGAAPVAPAMAVVTFEIAAAEMAATACDLVLTVEADAGGLHGRLAGRRDLFEPISLRRLAAHWTAILAEVAGEIDREISTLSLLSPGERQQILREWNATAAAYPELPSLHRAIEMQVERSPHAIALSFAESALSYAALNARANLLASRLRGLGVGPEVPVAIAAERSLELVVGLLAILKAGGAYVPLDPSYPRDRLAFMLAELMACGGSVLLAPAAVAESLPEPEARTSPRRALHRVLLDAGPAAAATPTSVSAAADAAALSSSATTWPTSSTPRARRGGPRG